jgi:hypothetical protein
MLDRKGWNETGRHRTSKSFVYFLVYKGLNYTTVRVALYLISLLSHIITYLISLLMIFVFDLCYSHCMPLLPLYQIISKLFKTLRFMTYDNSCCFIECASDHTYIPESFFWPPCWPSLPIVIRVQIDH